MKACSRCGVWKKGSKPMSFHPWHPLLIAGLCALGTPAHAQSIEDALGGFDEPSNTPKSDATSMDDILGGFEDSVPSEAPPVADFEISPWTISGSLSFSAAYDYTQNTPASTSPDFRGLSRARTKGTLDLKGNLPDQFVVPVRVRAEVSASHDAVFGLRDRGRYSDPHKNAFERDIRLGEVYGSAVLDDGVELTVGRQIIVWGTSENLRVVDMINPLDRSELGMVDIEDVRQPLAMVRGDYITGPWIATALVIPHIRFNTNAPSQGPYDFQNGVSYPNDVPSDGLGNAELAASLRGAFSGWDLSLHAANLYDDAGNKQAVDGETRIRHARINMLGVTGDVALGNWLVKGEVAHLSGLHTQGVANTDFSRTDVLAGLEFSGLPDASLSFEVVNRHLSDWTSALRAEGLKRNSQEYALRLSGDYMHDRLHVTALTTRISPLQTGGGFSRGTVEYDIADALSISGGLTVYHDGTRTPFNGIGDNDRLFFEVKKSF